MRKYQRGSVEGLLLWVALLVGLVTWDVQTNTDQQYRPVNPQEQIEPRDDEEEESDNSSE